MTSTKNLAKEKIASLVYHDIFDYPLTIKELTKWRVGEEQVDIKNRPLVEEKDGYFFLKKRESIVKKRLVKEVASARKIKILERLKKYFFLVPSIKFVGITGSLAMGSADSISDIDLLLITKTGTMWSSRLLLLLVLKIFSIPIRRSESKKQQDMLCLNMWLDENDLTWVEGERNIFTAHEIAQIIPLINKDSTYERLVFENKWLLDYWPMSVRVKKPKTKKQKGLGSSLFEKLAYWGQRLYMRGKITHEVITPTRALFHPKNLSGEVLLKLRKKLYIK